MAEKVEITICLGSSCFARGNKKIVEAIQSYINKHSLGDKVILGGGHCFGDCTKGPVVKINNIIYENVDSLNIFDILSKELEKLE